MGIFYSEELSKKMNEIDEEIKEQSRIVRLSAEAMESPEILETLEIDDLIKIKNYYEDSNRKKEKILSN